MSELWLALTELLDAGGFVMPWLLACAAGLWFALGWRAMTLQRGDRRSVRQLVVATREGSTRPPRGIVDHAVLRVVQRARRYEGAVPRAVLDEIVAPPLLELKSMRTMVRSIVAIAPLAGLLGTVTGMIETFRSLAEMALFTQGGGIAGGIGEALLTTQMGLAVAVPGLILGRILERREARLRAEVHQLTDLLASTPLQEVAA